MYDVMAVGNALVDHEYLITEDQLATKSLTKGSMTLADCNKQDGLLNEFRSAGITSSNQTGGGAAANAMYALSSLGGKSFYACRVGDDEAGQFYLTDLNQAGVATADSLAITQGGVTGSCIVAITPDGQRTMQTHLGTSGDINASNVDFDAISKSEWLYFEGYLGMSESIRPALKKLREQARANNTKIAVSFADPSVVNFGKEGLVEMIGDGVDAIFCNVVEANLFTGKTEIEASTRALAEHTKLAVVTSGPDDTVICQRQADGSVTLSTHATPKVDKVIDTNGAGDNYSGVFLYALINQYSIAQCASLASEVSSQIIQQFGPRLAPQKYKEIAKRV